MSRFNRTPQRQGDFQPDDPLSGYYNDLTPEVRSPTPTAGLQRLDELIRHPHINMTTVVQLGLASWQLGGGDSAWFEVTKRTAEWLDDRLDESGRLPFEWAMPHTYELPAPWISAIVQGEAVSLFVRAAALDRPNFLASAERASRPLFAPSPLVAATPEGPVLQEYPTTPPSHVLNGWIYGLWGLYDLAATARVTPELDDGVGVRAGRAFEDGVAALAARLHLYDIRGWSLYDLYPHPLPHVASPYYHRLHVELLRALARLAPDERLSSFADRWERTSARRTARSVAVARKVAFRVLRPRRFRLGRQTVSR